MRLAIEEREGGLANREGRFEESEGLQHEDHYEPQSSQRQLQSKSNQLKQQTNNSFVFPTAIGVVIVFVVNPVFLTLIRDTGKDRG
jgi:hypothetical protein